MTNTTATTGASSDEAVTIDPAILYWGTPVVLVSTLNEDDSPNLAPMSSAWWLGWGCMLGFTESANSVQNLRRTGECVLNLPSAELAGAVDRIARTTGNNPVPPDKAWLGFEYEPDKFGRPHATSIRHRLCVLLLNELLLGAHSTTDRGCGSFAAAACTSRARRVARITWLVVSWEGVEVPPTSLRNASR